MDPASSINTCSDFRLQAHRYLGRGRLPLALSSARKPFCERAGVTKRKAGPNKRPGFSWKGCNHPPWRTNPLPYLLLQGAGCWQHFLWQQAPRERVVAARAMTAAILVMVVMVLVRLLSLLVACPHKVTPFATLQKKKPDRLWRPGFGKCGFPEEKSPLCLTCS